LEIPVDTMAFILGGLLIAVALLGGGFEVHELKVPAVGGIGRLLCFIVGAVFIGLAVFLTPGEKETHPSAGNATSVAPQPVKVESGEKAEWLTAAEYQLEFNKKASEGFYPDKVEGRCESGSEQFHAEWKALPLGESFASHHAVTKEVYESKNQEYVSEGYSLESLYKFKDCSGTDRYQATWLKR
jgi:hypothetical protein